MPMTGSPGFTDNEIYRLATEGYLYELGMLIRLVKSRDFKNLLPFFLDYEKFLSRGKEAFFGRTYLRDILMNRRVIDGAVKSGVTATLFSCANLASWCEIFGGWTIPFTTLDSTQTREYLQMAIHHGGREHEKLGQNMAIRLNNGDTVRVIQVLKLLGLVSLDSSACDQLSLGASTGQRDRHALHLTPWIKPAEPMLPISLQSRLKFGVDSGHPESVVLIDNDPEIKSIYESLNTEEGERVCAINMDLYDGLSRLAEAVINAQVKPRNLVAAFRIEPAAFSDIGLFLELLGKVVNKSADLIFTIGSGNSLDGFVHRLEVLDELDQKLLERGMTPVRVKCYKGRTLEQKRANPVYGLNQYASYETLYCRITREQLVGGAA
jgi:hypothetical protein